MPNFDGLRVAAFESRRAEEMARLIERQGGRPSVSPSMREVAQAENPQAVEFAQRLMTGGIDVVLLLTGVGVRHLVATVERHVDRQRFLSALADTTTVVRGPKPLAVMKELNITPTFRVPEPNTWRELLTTLDTHVPLAGQTVAMQEYGKPNPSLVAGLEARGAHVVRVKVYDWELPADTGPLEANVQAIAAEAIDVVLFTSAHQVENMLGMAMRLGLECDVRRGLGRAVVASIGPTTSEALRQNELSVDLEPEHGRMGQLVVAAAEASHEILARKRRLAATLAARPKEPEADQRQQPWHDSLMMRALRREPTSRTPIWLMRQAGRYMAEYREVRAKTTFLDLCKNPALCAEVAVTAVERLQVDAAIIFSDLLPILEPMGLDLEFGQGEGPVIHNPVREAADVDRVLELTSVSALDYVMQTVRQTRTALSPKLPLLGFAGAPFTLASYAIEGGGSRNYLFTKTLMYRDRGAWDALMGRLVRAISIYVNAQIAAGVQAVQLFDSWVGCLGPDDYRRYVLPHSRSLIQQITPGVPVIHFGTGNPALTPLLSEAGGDVIGVDWRAKLGDSWRAIGPTRGIMGNFDPLVLLADKAEIRRRAKDILDQAAGHPGHIFNLGHGVLPQTPVENAIVLVEAVKELSER